MNHLCKQTLRNGYRKLRMIKSFVVISVGEYSASRENIRGGGITEALLLAHSLEKGMGLNHVKAGFGIEKVKTLLHLLEHIIKDGRQTDTYDFIESMGIVKAYCDLNIPEGYNIKLIYDEYERLLGKLPESVIADIETQKCGFEFCRKEELLCAASWDFSKFLDLKHSIRFFDSLPIERCEIEKAISLASKSPSACNRQPNKVYFSLNKNTNELISELVPGNKGFEQHIPYYMVVAVDRNCFGAGEIYQWYINSGIFLSYLTLALHSIGIGSCIFQWPLSNKKEKALCRITGIPSNEAITAIIGYGNYAEVTKCIYASRKPFKDIAVEF